MIREVAVESDKSCGSKNVGCANRVLSGGAGPMGIFEYYRGGFCGWRGWRVREYNDLCVGGRFLGRLWS